MVDRFNECLIIIKFFNIIFSLVGSRSELTVYQLSIATYLDKIIFRLTSQGIGWSDPVFKIKF